MRRAASLPITIGQVTKTYGALHALDHVDLEVKSGEFMTLLGPSGSGKTTLLMVLAGFTRPDHGSVMFGDREVVRLAPHKREVGMVFQSYALFPHMDVAGNIGFPLRLRGMARHEVAERVAAALDTVKLSGLGARRVDQLSGGQRQRVALARAIVFEPRILLMDEPLSALDKQLREHMQIELRQLHDKLGMTTVYVTHDQREALTMSDRIAVINDGRIMQLDTPRRVYEQPSSRFVAEFIGESVFLPVTVAGGRCVFDGRPLHLCADQAVSDGAWLLMLRPERLRIDIGDNPGQLNLLPAKVAGVVYQGDSFIVQAELSGGSRVNVRAASRSDTMSNLPDVGQPVELGLHPRDVFLLPDGGP